MTWLAFKPELSAITPARSNEFIVKSRCKSDVDSGRNSANAIAPAEVMEVEDRKRRLSAVLSVNAVRSDWIYRCLAPGCNWLDKKNLLLQDLDQNKGFYSNLGSLN